MTALDDFRLETRAWLAANCPAGARGPGPVSNGSTKIRITDRDTLLWLDRMRERGWTVPNWPKAYGGSGLTKEQYVVLLEEMRAIKARPALSSFGTSMIGPTLLEFGTEAQKLTHLTRIARAEVEWCQGYSEPGSGSDLASLRTRADDQGDHFIINGSKIWTSGAHHADWMFCLVRTDHNAEKQKGISFVLLPMNQPGVTVKPIRILSGESTFNQVFFDNATASKTDLVGRLNDGWTVGKRLLQHERSGMESLVSGGAGTESDSLVNEARKSFGVAEGRIADAAFRERLLKYEIHNRAFRLSQRRAVQESDGGTPGAVTSIFKVVGSELQQTHHDLQLEMRGPLAYVPGDPDVKQWLFHRAATIYSGSNEVQRNILAKRVLGLPD